MVDWAAYVRQRLDLTGLESWRQVEVVEDLAHQLEDAYREAIVGGASEAQARAEAERHIADWTVLSRQLAAGPRGRRPPVDRWSERADDRRADRGRAMRSIDRWRQDLVYGWRLIRRAPGVAAMAILSLAVGIGANTAIFSVMRALVFRPLDVPDATRLVTVTDPQASGAISGLESGDRTLLSYDEFVAIRAARGPAVTELAALGSSTLATPVAVGAAADGPPARVQLVSGSFFPLLGVAPAIGRTFGDDVDRARMASPVAVVSQRFWQRQYGDRADLAGASIRLRRTTFDVIGVMPARFTGVIVGDTPDVWVPVTMQEAITPSVDWLTTPPGSARRVMFLHALGRLAPGATVEQARSALNGALAQKLNADAAGIGDASRRRELVDAHLAVRDGRYGFSPLRAEYQRPLVVLMGLVALLLLLACANVANLQLARATGRQRELAMRIALGAGRRRLVRQLLTESLLIAAAGALLGLGLAWWGDRVLLRLAGGSTPIPLDTPIDAAVLAFTAAVTVVTGLLFGIVPALRTSGVDLNVVLRAAAPNLGGRRRLLWRWSAGQLLAGAQVALSLVLLFTAGLFVRSLRELGEVPLGYDASSLVEFRVTPTNDGVARAEAPSAIEEIVATMAAAPGVIAASFSSNGLFYGAELGSDVSFPGRETRQNDMSTRFDLVGPRYFATVGIPIRRGRDVVAADATGLPGCWINETAARDFFGDADPIGARMVAHFSFGDAEYEIRGVVADALANSVRDGVTRRFYLPYRNFGVPQAAGVVIVRTADDAAAAVSTLRQRFRDTHPASTTPTFYPVRQILALDFGRDRIIAALASVFGVCALALASFGLYGVLAYSASRRTSEIGLRLALGARRASVVALMLREAGAIVIGGAIAGVVTAILAGRVLDSLLFGLTGRDPATMTFASVVLFGVAAAAALAPTLRATRVDPLIALRRE
ncbi:MAG TPA: ADOP family duplicated permease [Vicinamibacterales bacterium]|nr:ADOP family duplicated permease [Vicinamibacterales bacterium]